MSDICGEDRDKEVKVEFFQSKKNGRHINQGQFLFTVADIKADNKYFLTKSNGEVVFDKCLFQKRNSFLEYIFGGCELNLAIAIDFTLSNGDPKSPDSLHC